MRESRYSFSPARYQAELSAIIQECMAVDALDDAALQRILRKYPKDGRGFFSKSEIIRGYRHLQSSGGAIDLGEESEFVRRMRMKPVRTASGVAPVTVLTQPFPCPGECVFCPSDVRMPKSYLSSEPGAQRAAEHRFDPYAQTASRLTTLHNIGHSVDKVELIVLGGTWSSYPQEYRVWFIKRCFDALNDFDSVPTSPTPRLKSAFAFERVVDRVDGADLVERYNEVVQRVFREDPAARPVGRAAWLELSAAQLRNETSPVRCVGLSLETRPDHLTREEVLEMRRLGATKVQLGYQSLDDEVLRRNRRGHDVAATRQAMTVLRSAGFKIHAHWMPNLLGSSPDRDVEDFERIFSDEALRPDELKIYPCSLVESAELMSHYRDGSWRPYTKEELGWVLEECMLRTPPWCRLTRVIRDIPSTDIVTGNKLTNFREIAQAGLRRRGERVRDIRSREVGGDQVRREDLHLEALEYQSSEGREIFSPVC